MDYPVRTSLQLGTVIRGFRSARGVTQVELGKKTGLAQNAISEFERDPSKSSIRKLYQLLSALGVELVLREVTPVPPSTKRARTAATW